MGDGYVSCWYGGSIVMGSTPKMDGLVHGKSEHKDDDDWRLYPISGNLHMASWDSYMALTIQNRI